MSFAFSLKATLILLLTVAGGSLGGVGYYYTARAADLISQVQSLESSFQTQLDSLNAQLAADQAEIIQLQAQISQLQTQLASGLCLSGKTITIGELLDLSDGLATQGVRAKDGSAIAISD